MRILTVLCIVLVVVLAASAQMADTIYVNGNIYPGAEIIGKRAKPPARAQAMAVAGERILAIGTAAEMEKLRTRKTKVVDLGGRFVMPGFNDAHTHLAGAGFEKLNVSLNGTKSLDEMKARIAERVKTAAPGEWIIGRGWDHTLWASQTLPTRHDLDAVTGDHPAIFTRVDGHISVVNTAALQLSKITGVTKAPAGGTVDLDAKGEPTGILRESARQLLASVPRPTPSQRRRALELALAEAAEWGVTSAQDNSEWEDFLVFEELQAQGKLTLRISEWLPFTAPLDRLQKHRAHHPQSDLWLRTGLLKGVMDGTLGSRTAAMLQPYSDDAGNTGLPQFDQQKLNEMAAERVLAGFQLGFHAIGDRAAEMAITAFEAALRAAREQQGKVPVVAGQKKEFRLRIEHAQVMEPAQYARVKALGAIASMQPNHLLTDMNWAMARIGERRARHSYPWAEMLQHGIPLAFGTDYPVEPITPFRGVYAAVTRKNEAGSAEYVPEQKLDIHTAIAAYTTGSAYAEFTEREKGRLAPGMLADFIVLDRDITAVPPAEILKTRVLRTVAGGKTVYEAQ